MSEAARGTDVWKEVLCSFRGMNFAWNEVGETKEYLTEAGDITSSAELKKTVFFASNTQLDAVHATARARGT